MIQAVIFDWAGTTVDYGCFAPVQAFQEAFAHHGVPVTLEETRKPMGMLKRDHIRTMLSMDRMAKSVIPVDSRASLTASSSLSDRRPVHPVHGALPKATKSRHFSQGIRTLSVFTIDTFLAAVSLGRLPISSPSVRILPARGF